MNMSSMRPVMRNPPAMFTADMATAAAANVAAVPAGAAPPRISSSAPTAVMPEMALVTDMSGEWSAAVTPVTAKYPTTHASENVLTMATASAGGPAAPMTHISARNVPKSAADFASPSHAGGGRASFSSAVEPVDPSIDPGAGDSPDWSDWPLATMLF